MAKRRKLELPNPEELSKLESEFRSETPTRTLGVTPPIAQVAAEAASGQSIVSAEARAKVAKDQHDATAYRDAQDQGLLVSEIAVDQIEADDMMRDRTVFLDDEMRELEDSILQSGLRLPIEVYELPKPIGEKRYGLISGYRRLLAVRALFVRTQDLQFRHVKAFIRKRGSLPQAMAAMVEENEIRANLSHFERGRLVGLTVQNGIFQDVDTATAKLFGSASKAKRSKIRSFALIFEELGDVLTFPEALSERLGLRLAQRLKLEGGTSLRQLLSESDCASSEDERAVIEAALEPIHTKTPPKSQSGQSKTQSDTVATMGDTRVSHKRGVKSVTFKVDANLSDQALERMHMAIARILQEEQPQ